MSVSSKWKSLLYNRNIRVDCLCLFFGIGTWLGYNAVFVQLPLLVEVAPENWTLPSFIIIICQLANIGPLLYTLIQKYSPRRIPDNFMIYGIYVMGCITILCMAFLHEITAFVAGQERSVALFVSVFFVSLIGCTSAVLFMPYMGRFKEIYLITFFIGDGFSALLPSVLALIQGIGGSTECIPNENNDGFTQNTPPALFSTTVFFIIIFILFAISGVSFIALDTLKMSKSEYDKVTIKYGNDYSYNSNKNDANDSDEKSNLEDIKIISSGNQLYLLILMGIVSMFGHSILPSIQSYSCLPYGNITYHLTVTMSIIAIPFACFMAVFLPHKSTKLISILVGLMAVITAYALATAVLSPSPPLVGTAIGEALVIISYTLVIGLVSYIKLSITSIMRYQGGQSLVWTGAITQTGSFFGAVLAFSLVNFTNIFISFEPC